MRIRKNVRSLTAEERRALVDALLILKRRNRYDQYVHWHHHLMVPTVMPYEPRDANYRNGAHRGPAFLPWHREFLLQVENDLQGIEPSIAIPYWDWTQDTGMAAPGTSPVWDEDFMGGDGVEADQWRVATGPFAHATGDWPVPAYPEAGLPGLGLKRRFGRVLPTLPTIDDVKLAMSELFYDTPNFNQSPFTIGFRNRLEGWITQRGDPRVKTTGSQLHNRVHLWVGGNMEPMTSPDDPVFFLHHCFVDKLWADWQARQKRDNPDAAPHYCPVKGGPEGHNLGNTLHPWTRTIQEVLDIDSLGYSYEQPVPPDDTPARAGDAVSASQIGVNSPFWAD